MSAIFILDLKGKVLISRDYRGDISLLSIEKFMPLILNAEELDQTPGPCLKSDDNGIHFLYIKHNNLYCMHILMHCMYNLLMTSGHGH